MTSASMDRKQPALSNIAGWHVEWYSKYGTEIGSF